eukprot:TRINITY_DN3057_c0_g1_i2.p1 TRINITY_DN3057_c0_g1~~TRINITY_DN3057_c0_g1_i2.p1  ORF type:complete len:203 (+),score=25.34 TRINITY_DN3057_c0_g1_i2:132-740(+)
MADVQSMPPAGNSDYDKEFNVLIIGDADIGKTCLLLRYINGTYEENHKATIAADCLTKCIERNGQRIGLSCWDTAGQERYRTITASYYRNANAVILAYAVDDPSSFENVDGWYGEVNRYCAPSVVVALVGTRQDLPVQVRREARQYARDNRMLTAETSAKDGTGVEEAFTMIVDKLLTYRTQRRNTVSAREGLDDGHKAKCC